MEFEILGPYEHQVAGHKCSLFSSVVAQSGKKHWTVAKEYCAKEACFYEQMPTPLACFPVFYGVFTSDKTSYIVLEDLLADYERPSIIDIKLGSRTYDDDATAEKKAKMIQKCNRTTSSTLFFRIAGMKIWDGTRYIFYDKKYCNRTFNCSDASLLSGFGLYLGRNSLREEMALLIKETVLTPLEKFVNAELYSSSLLLYYDDARRGCSLVDFAHSKWTPGSAVNADYIQGVRNLLSLLSTRTGDGE